MKLYPNQLAAELNKGLNSLYILSGEETLLVNECADGIRSACRQHGFSERELFHVDSNHFDWESVLQSLNSMSLFSEKKLVEIRCGNHKPNNKLFLKYFETPNPDTVILIITNKLDSGTTKSKWFKQLESHGTWISVWPIEGNHLLRWLQQRCKQEKVNINPGALQLLQERIEGNLLAAAQEISKLALLFGQQPIDENMLIEAVADSSRYNVFTLSDKVLSGDSKASLKILQGLEEEGTAETVVLWALSKDLRTLVAVKGALEKGEQINWALKQQGVWEKRQPLFQKALQRLSLQQLQQLLQNAGKIDLAIKGMENKKPWDELGTICLTLCTGKNYSNPI